MILEAAHQGCVREVLIITAALSIQDPRERPTDAREAADAMHARFAEPGSDFLPFLTLWDYLHEQQRELSGSAFRRMCRREHLHYLRVREWQDLHGQLRQAARDVGIGAGAGPIVALRAGRAAAAQGGPGPELQPARHRPARHPPAGHPAARRSRGRGSRRTSRTGCTCRCWPACSPTSG